MKTIIWSVILILIILSSCHNLYVQDESRNFKDVRISLDSIYINYYKKKESHDPPYVFFYYNLWNGYKDTIVFYVRWCEFENNRYTRKIFSIYRRDTFELFRGDLTPEVVELKPQNSIHIVLNPSPISLMNYYENNKGMYLSMQDFLYDYAIHSINSFNLGDEYYYIDTTMKRKVIFRDPNDTIEQIWK